MAWHGGRPSAVAVAGGSGRLLCILDVIGGLEVLTKSFLDDDIADFAEENIDSWYGEYYPFHCCLSLVSSSGVFENFAEGESPST